MRLISCAVVGLISFSLSTAAMAQGKTDAYSLKNEVAAELRIATRASSSLEAKMREVLPTLDGWACQEEVEFPIAVNPLPELLPMISFQCEHLKQSLRVIFTLDPSDAEFTCRAIETKLMGIADGRVKPDIFRLFESPKWRIMRSGSNLMGCSEGALSLRVFGERSQASIDAGPALLDNFAQALLELNIVDVVQDGAFPIHQQALHAFVEGLKVQSDYLAALIPIPDAVSHSDIRHSLYYYLKERDTPVGLSVVGSPAVIVRFEIDGCHLFVELSAAENTISESMAGLNERAVGRQELRNTDRFIGYETLDGTSIEALVDGQALVRISVSGSGPCESDPDIVSRLFDEITANDLSVFGIR